MKEMINYGDADANVLKSGQITMNKNLNYLNLNVF